MKPPASRLGKLFKLKKRPPLEKPMKILLITHAKNRMRAYDITETQLIDALEKPDSITKGHSERLIAQKRINGKILRVVFEQDNEAIVVVTAYKARAKRYEI